MWFSEEKRNEFLAYFPDIVKQLEDKAATLDDIEKGKHFREILEYTVPGGKRYGGVIVVETYKTLLPKSEQTPENIKLCYYLGWCMELFYDCIFMSDDIMDGGKMRRNRPCWYTLEHVGLSAINDACLLETGMYYLLLKNFGHLDCYLRLYELIHDSAFLLYLGQYMSVKYSKDAFDTSIKLYKMAMDSASVYIASYLPVALGMTLAGRDNPEVLRKAKSILSQLGYFYLIDNDYMDCFGDPALTGKVGTDIQTGKCRWPIVAFMEKASPEQKKLMRANYGKDNEENVAVAKQLFEEINIHKIYTDYVLELYQKLMKDIEENSYGEMKQIYLALVQTIPISLKANGILL
uniref:Polyprenyl synthetase n=2 Tax=Lutzomyia longipalpis TaxID=7200 RepID=A0A1B0C9R4_LUTLO